MPSDLPQRLFFCLVGLALLVSDQSGWAQTSPEFRAVWADAWGGDFTNSAKSDTLMNNLRAGNMNALIVQARRRGDAFYQSNYEPKNMEIATGFDPLGYLIQKGHDTSGGKKKVEIHAWIVTYHVWKGFAKPTDPTHPLNLHPDWLMKDVTGTNYTGGEYTFDQGHPEVQRHTYNVAMNIITNYNVDGLNFDYVRYSSINEGYNDVTVARFNRLYARTGQPSPSDADWKQFRRDQVTALVRKVYLNAIAARPEVKISADTITWAPGPTSDSSWYNSSAAWNSVLQDWRGWMEEGILDINVPMNYFRQWTHLNDFLNWSTFAKDRQFNRHIVNGPGIYLNSVSDAIWQMRQSRTTTAQGNVAQGMCGYSYRVTNKDGVSTASFMNALVNPSVYDTNATPMFATWVPTPDMPWKTAPTRGHLKGYLLGHTDTNFLDGGTITISGPLSKTMKSDGTGFYGAVDLPPGTYTANASFPGYAIVTTNITVTIGTVKNVDFLLPPSGLSIIDHPAGQTLNRGDNLTLSVNAAGEPPIRYQWLFESAELSNQTNAQLFLNNVQQSHSGTYSVVVSNATGSIASSNAIVVVRVPPQIDAQPQSVAAAQGDDVTFFATVTGTAPLSFQWRRNGTNLAGATLNSYTLANAQPSHAGNYSIVASNPAGSTTSSNAILTVSVQPVAPYIVEAPVSRSAYEGQSANFRVRANGTVPLNYQWNFNGTPIAGATKSILAFSEVEFAKGGQYSVLVSNSISTVLSSPVNLAVLPPFPVGGLEVLWKLAPGSRPYLGTGSTERGLAYNPVSGNLLLVSRASGTKIYVLDADTGNELHTLDTTGVNGGTFSLNMIGVADDGAVYACNLITAPPGFKIYRWENDDPTTVPTVIFNGDPVPGTGDRWGDSIDIRRSGIDTQILVGGRHKGTHCLFTTTNGISFSPNFVKGPLNSATSATFGNGHSFWIKEPSQALLQIGFQPGNTNGTLLNTVATSSVPGTAVSIGFEPAFQVLGSIGIETPDKFRLYDLNSIPPTLIASELFATDNANANWVGSVDFGDDRVFALDTNNGIIALRLVPQGPLRLHSISLLPQQRIGFQTDMSPRNHKVEGSSNLIHWQEITNIIPTNGYFEITDPQTNTPHRFYRTVLP